MKPRRTSRPLNDMPGLFDITDFTIDSRPEIEQDIPGHRQRVLERGRNTTFAAVSIDDDVAAAMRFVSFGSGSSGNCSYVGSQRCGVLVDAGVDADKVVAGLKANGLDPEKVAGIIVTHDHGDHVRYAYTLLRRYPHMKLWATPRCMNGILRRHSMSRRIKDYHAAIYKEFAFTVGPLTITAFETSHDGTDNVGFCIEMGGHTLVVATDTGYMTERADYYIRQANHLMIEANYDADMLRRCNRPEYLKARIASERGHMDNKDTAAYLVKAWTPALSHIFLCHLSEDTNTPQQALTTVREALEEAGITVGDGSASLDQRCAQVQLTALPRFDCSPLVIFR